MLCSVLAGGADSPQPQRLGPLTTPKRGSQGPLVGDRRSHPEGPEPGAWLATACDPISALGKVRLLTVRLKTGRV